MSPLVQVQKLQGRVERVRRGETPIVELKLHDHQQVVSIELEEIDRYGRVALERKTVDWRWTAYVATTL